MRLELLRRTGQPVLKELWRSAGDVPVDYLDECVKDELTGFYDGNDREFWPKPEFGEGAPEVARIVDEDGDVLAEYDVDDLAEDTGRSLAAAPVNR